MTQIISVITEKYVLLASDRRLTIGEGPRQGEICDDDTCKLVSFCDICGLAYSGLADIEGLPTHEWVAKTLASVDCCDANAMSWVLMNEANKAFAKVRPSIRRHTFLIAGWAYFESLPVPRSYFCAITNTLDDSGRLMAKPRDGFDRRVRALRDNEPFLWCSIGEPVRDERAKYLERNLRQLVERSIGPKEALRILVEEVIYKSTKEKCKTVGSKILGFCIPRQALWRWLKLGHGPVYGQQPSGTSAIFTYFEPEYNDLHLYGPTIVCGSFVATDFETENDPARNSHSS